MVAHLDCKCSAGHGRENGARRKHHAGHAIKERGLLGRCRRCCGRLILWLRRLLRVGCECGRRWCGRRCGRRRGRGGHLNHNHLRLLLLLLLLTDGHSDGRRAATGCGRRVGRCCSGRGVARICGRCCRRGRLNCALQFKSSGERGCNEVMWNDSSFRIECAHQCQCRRSDDKAKMRPVNKKYQTGCIDHQRTASTSCHSFEFG